MPERLPDLPVQPMGDLDQKSQEELERLDMELRVELKRANLLKTALEVNELAAKGVEAEASASSNNEFSLTGDVNARTVGMLVQALEHAARRSPGCELTIKLDTHGGSVFDGLHLYDVIMGLRDKGHKVVVHVRGKAWSMGSILLQAADVRIMSPNSWFMIHKVSAGTMGRIEDMEEDVDFYGKINAQGMAILASRSKWTVKDLKDRSYKKELWMTAKQAKRHGFCDRVSY